ncbi:MAG TPA: phage terminase large subunit [Pyrinomonadaceae bacterium]|nr:phage terminase large subunit [Pyrinomonadaceae bacterium]
MKEPQNPRYDACLRLYLQNNGKNLLQIERGMHALGYDDFSRRILYNRKENGKYKPGWIESYGWKEKLAVSGSPSNEKAALPYAEFEAWLKQVSPDYRWDWKHQLYIYRHLQLVTSGETKRLMIFLPPRHGKSELVTVRYAGWRLWNDPAMRIIVSSYSQRLADKFSRSVRRLLAEEEDKLRQRLDRTGQQELLQRPDKVDGSDLRGAALAGNDVSVPSSIPKERMFPPSRKVNSAAQWETALGGGVKAVGVGAGVTGFGAQLIIIDDPVKNRAQAESDMYRENVWDWYRNDLYTRLEPNGSIILIQTRWHEDDLAGRLLRDMQDGGDQWEVINLPALAEERNGDTPAGNADALVRNEGEPRTVLPAGNAGTPACTRAPHGPSPLPIHDSPFTIHRSSPDPLGRPPGAALCPERYDERALNRIKRQLGAYAFSALYQQRPTPSDGGIFKRAWFGRFVDRAPEGLKWKRGYDLAVSTKTTSCYTTSFRVAYDQLGNLYIADGFRKRIEFPDQRRYIVSRLLLEKDTEHGIEKALHGEGIIQDLRRDPAVRGSNLKGVTVTTDKVTRALKWAPLAEEGKVVLVRGPWNQAFLDEICAFPNGQFDDQVDAVSLAVTMFAEKRRYGTSF